MTDCKNDSSEPDLAPLHDAFLDHKSVLVSYLAQYVISHEDVEDILQDTYLKTMEAGQKRAINSPRAYLFIVARNLILKKLKKRSKHMMVDIDEIDESRLVVEQVPADRLFYDRQQFDVFREAAASLPAQCRRVFLMRKIKGMSQKEIAKEMKISESTVERHITKAIARCHEFMKKKGYERSGATRGVPVRAAEGDVCWVRKV